MTLYPSGVLTPTGYVRPVLTTDSLFDFWSQPLGATFRGNITTTADLNTLATNFNAGYYNNVVAYITGSLRLDTSINVASGKEFWLIGNPQSATTPTITTTNGVAINVYRGGISV